jgi:nucleoside-diphosphate-sugar epimerase
MPPTGPGTRVLVSGANGYIATWLVRILLEQGYAVRGTVRSLEKNLFLGDLFKSYGEKFELVVVEDIVKEEAFDEAVKGIDAIIHAASPLRFDVEEPKDFIEPAVNGTLSILKRAIKAPNIKRIVIVASTGCVFRTSSQPVVLSEKDWNDQAIEQVERLGREASTSDKYAASKTLAEKAAWTFYREHQAQINWDLVVINPSYVFGPTLNPVSSPSGLGASLALWYDAVVDPKGLKAHLSEPSKSWIDVRDLAVTLAKSLVVPEAGGERILVTAGSAVWQDWLDVANALSPCPIPSHSRGSDRALPIGNPGEGRNAIHRIKYDTSKAERILRPVYRTMEETARDTLADFEQRGW